MTHPNPILSVIVPAYNEQTLLRQTLLVLKDSLVQAGIQSYEIIVSDDASTDLTPNIAQEEGASVVFSGKRNIGGTRNVGASHAKGEFLLFVDADTDISPTLLTKMLETFEAGAVGGGARVSFQNQVPFTARISVRIWNLISRTFSLPAGSFLFTRRADFEAIGGFDEKYYISEELDLAKRLRKRGRLVILNEAVCTSERKIHDFTSKDFYRLFWRMVRHPFRVKTDKEHLDIWYQRRS